MKWDSSTFYYGAIALGKQTDMWLIIACPNLLCLQFENLHILRILN